ncbi:MAG: FAD-binding oxidoreductase [Sediminimonas qiaohouensis]|uniref:FAD-binding oxidoreductase n=1 Tax=Sediminimonas qiaohouensis TaxID=552061 RepID=A0A7C9LM83_9RHOB|nr:FAD-binding oxidoreductase [Sediminimonas qiaohouensis]MTJ05359.1 FAD-binding oxidoreductase [Sediminimonas qiaohouensis]
MRRIFPAHAYGDAPLGGCYWADTVPDTALHRPPAEGGLRADVVIIGAGFTGLSAALHMAEGGADVIVLEAAFPGWGASGRNGGFCCLGGAKIGDATLRRYYGEDARRAWRRTEAGAVSLTADLIARHAIEADTHSQGETILAHNIRQMRRLRDAAPDVARDYGVTPEVLEAADLPAHGMAGPFQGALTVPIGFALNPRKYLAGLLNAAEGAGARVHGQSPVEAIKPDGGGLRVSTPRAEVTAKRVILATNGYSSEDVPAWMAARYLPAQSNVLTTRPLDQVELDAAGWTSRQMAYDTRNLLHYFRLMPDNRFLFGMRGGLQSSDAADARIAHLARRHFETMFPAWSHVDTPHSWSGMVCFSARALPYCGPIPGLPGAFAGFAYHGNGVAMGSYTGALLADVAMDRPARLPYPEVMRAPARRFPLGRMRRALMWPAYAMAGLSDF